MKLILARHGNGFHNETDLMHHPSLTMLGKIQARMAAKSIVEYLQENNTTKAKVYMHVSPSLRTIETCDIIFDRLFDNGMSPTIYSVHEGLMERFESDADISLQDQEMCELMQMLGFDEFDGMVQKTGRKRKESHVTVQKNMLAFLHSMHEQQDKKFQKRDYHIIVSHSGTLSSFLHDFSTKGEKSKQKPNFRVLQGEVIFVEYTPSGEHVPEISLMNMRCLSEENGHLDSYGDMPVLKARWPELRTK